PEAVIIPETLKSSRRSIKIKKKAFRAAVKFKGVYASNRLGLLWQVLVSKRALLNTIRQGKSPTIPSPFPWATKHRANIHSLKYLSDAGSNVISGEVQCKHCDQQYDIEYDLKSKFLEVAKYVAENKYKLRERAPLSWTSQTLPNCKFCNKENCMKPVMSKKKKEINWLFLLLGQMLGMCTIGQLKYFCKHTRNHRTGAKDRVLFLTYLELCKQLDPTGPFERF
nr:actin cytoskeleton-regulatory complex protein PAN1-like [Tanacetum cinerariifolium]